MKKIYSIVLMATALLIGTNAWAADVPFSGTTGAELQTAMNNAASGTKLVFQNDVNLNDGPVWLGTANLDDPAKSITLDLNGHTIVRNASTNTAYYMFVITRGELIIDNGTVTLTGTTFNGTSFNEGSQIFSVFGSYKSSYWTADGTGVNANPTNTMEEGYFTHLEIGENLNVIGGGNVLGTAIAIDRLAKGVAPIKDNAINTAINYQTNVRASDSYGYAYGARVDVKGSITMLGKSGNYVKYETVNGVPNTAVTYGYKCYGIKTNGNLASPLNTGKGGIKAKSSLGFTTTDSYFDAAYNVEEHKHDTIDVPFVYVHKNARIVTNNGSIRSTAIYSSGYAKYLIKGTCEGNVGVNIKSGKVILDDATIASTATTYTQATGQGGASGSGSAVVLNSTSYEGGMQVTISGDTKITSDAGYAIEEVVNTQTTKEMANPDYVDETTTPGVSPTVEVKETKVLDIIFNGGTIEGGNKGAVVVSYDTEVANQDQDEETTITVYGATVTGETKVGKDGDLTDLLPTDESENPTAHITVVTDPETGKQTLVVSKGQEPITSNKVSDQAEDASVKWEGPDYVNDEIAANSSLKLKELVINDTITTAEALLNPSLTAGALREQTLTLRAGSSLTVDRVVLGSKAKIIVEPGAKFIVTGDQGIVAPVAENIVLKTSETAQATFLFNPEVQSNRHPMATVELISRAYRKENGQYVFQRFGVPSYADTVHRSSVSYTVPTAIYRYDYADQDWHSMAKTEQFVPFQCYEMTTQQATAGYVYTFKCPLVGNDNAELKIEDKWNYYANSYVAPINIKQLVSRLLSSNADAVDATIYLHQQEANWWMPVNKGMYLLPTSTAPKEIVPMQAFITKRVGSGASPVINYKEQIWTPIMDPSHTAFAPARNQQVVGTAVVEISDANGIKDEVTLLESDQFSADYDRSYDAEKYINTNSFNLFANENENQMAILATDNLAGTILSMTTKAQTTFTMTFSNVSNMDYAIRDMLTGTEVEIVEGATYMFSVPANASVAGRFQVVEPKKLPTAIEDVEENAAVKGIYTLTGQYVGNDYHNLPAGVYVVNGKKIVK